MDGMQPAMPTLTRPLTLNEFLLIKKPQNDIEILCCIGYYHQICNSQQLIMTTANLEEQLKLSPFKIANIAEALHQATEEFGCLTLQHENGIAYYSLTENGQNVVNQLPKMSD
jgi:hypothetical protein